MSDTHVSTHPSAPNTEVINVDDHDEDDNTEGRDQTAYRPTFARPGVHLVSPGLL